MMVMTKKTIMMMITGVAITETSSNNASNKKLFVLVVVNLNDNVMFCLRILALTIAIPVVAIHST